MTTVSYPRTSHIPLSESRRARFTSEAKETFNGFCLARLILTPVRTPDTDEPDFRKIGFNHIVDRIWFVDGVFEGAAYATPSGATYGSSVAERETELVLQQLIARALGGQSSLTMETPSAPNEEDICALLQRVHDNGYEPSVIIAGVGESLNFWNFRSFSDTHEVRRGLTSPEGYFRGVPVHYCRLLPDNVVLAADRVALGQLKIKKDFDISVTDITDNTDRERIRRELPSLSNADFNEKVRVLGFEVVKPIIQNNAYALMKPSETSLALNEYQ
ncbi:MAG: hypothetical protein WB661_12110 [Candidatus Bathyarchaeia archaeon]